MVDMLTGADVSNRSVGDHSEYLMLISLGLDGMLDADEKRRLDVHLERCSSCRAQRMLWQAIDSRLQDAPAPVPSPGFSHSVAQRLARQERRRNLQIGVILTVFTLLVWSLGLTGVCVLTGAVVYTNMDRFAETGLFLSEALAVAGVVGQSLWDVIVELTATPAALGVASAYMVVAVAALAVWCVVIQRTTLPFRSRI